MATRIEWIETRMGRAGYPYNFHIIADREDDGTWDIGERCLLDLCIRYAPTGSRHIAEAERRLATLHQDQGVSSISPDALRDFPSQSLAGTYVS